ncbi:SdrD B-like domain-containing protein [Fibrella aquatilis]|uniref:DUF11 domain-containing protein n=1 Tax=Fibrella aquatilis TaxID=2817059 RepID=A0A939K2E3_9BACT|nr:SdrD B-like domain-containing protein [Fibrella aquatilis]MBO0933220.1 DUF11 domain-containing protein [Fibrella aquatilis]
MKRLGRFLVIIGSLLTSFLSSYGQTISGIVFRDFNSDGVYTSLPTSGTYIYSEPGVGGVLITAYTSSGAVSATAVSSTVSATLGRYVLTVGNAGPYRIEFTKLMAGDRESFRGASSGTSIQFANGGASGVHFGINYPTDFCQSNPELLTNCYVFGNQLATTGAATITGIYGNDPVLVSFPYDAGSRSIAANTSIYDQPTAHRVAILARQVGTTLGLAYARTTKRLYTASFFKKHAGFGPAGPGAIYVSDATSTSTVSQTFTVPGANANAHDPTDYNRDNGDIAWDAVGKTSLGGMDLSDDDDTLYVMNLQNRTLYALNPTSGSVLSSRAVPLNPLPPGCPTAGDVRPFAVEYYRGRVYVGVVCSAESSNDPTDLKAYVYSVNPATLAFNATPAFQMDLNYPRGNAASTGSATWLPWRSTYANVNINPTVRLTYPMPILANLAFDNGDLIIGLRDRIGDIAGSQTRDNPATTDLYQGRIGGDLLRAGGSPERGWTLESNGRSEGNGMSEQNTGQGPGGAEFYHGDGYPIATGGVVNGAISGTTGIGVNHDEVSLGTMTQIPGFIETVAVVFDPAIDNGVDGFFDGGFRWMNNTTGAWAQSYRLYNGSSTGTDPGLADFGKAAGLGEVVPFCDLPPVMIGNRVWLDTDNDGVQDPGEAPLAGVTVTLKGPGLPAAGINVTTNTNGEYYFSTGVGTNSTGFVYGLTGLTAGGSYSLSFPASVTTSNAFLSSKPNAATGTNGDNIDTDVNSSGLISFVLGRSGENNFSYDAAYVPCVPPSITITASSLSVCQGNPISLSALVSPTGSYTYVWAAPAGVQLTGAATSAVVATGLTTGTKTFTVTVSSSPLCSTSATITVQVNALPVAGLSAAQATICAGQSTTLMASGGGTYRFSTGGAASSVNALTVSPAATTPYQVTVTTGGGCSGTATAMVTVNPVPSLLTKITCQGIATYDISFTTTAGASVVASAGNVVGSQVVGVPSGQTVSLTVMLNGCSLTRQFTQNCAANAAGLGDYVFVDTDNNGIQNAGDTPLAGVRVTLYTNGVASATTVTNASGFYSFTGLAPGSGLNYSVGFTTPAGYTATAAQQGGDGSKDSDPNPATGRTQSVTLANGEFYPDLDAGFYLLKPVLSVKKLVNKSKASVGDIISYTVILTNTGNAAATNVDVRDSTSVGLSVLPTGYTPPAGTTFTPGKPVGIWRVSSIGAGQQVQLTLQTKADSSGILYNVATIPGGTAQVCTSVPVRLCAGESYTIVLTAPAGRASYQWFKNGIALPGATAATLEVSSPGAYNLTSNQLPGLCTDYSCCPYIVEEDILPNFTAQAVAASCTGSTPQTNGYLRLTGFQADHTFQYSLGTSFDPATSLSGTAKAIPTNGIIAASLASPVSAQYYTIRVYNTQGCFTDRTVLLQPTVCNCPTAACAPFVVRKTRGGVR